MSASLDPARTAFECGNWTGVLDALDALDADSESFDAGSEALELRAMAS
jgi:hypothetical protein